MFLVSTEIVSGPFAEPSSSTLCIRPLLTGAAIRDQSSKLKSSTCYLHRPRDKQFKLVHGTKHGSQASLKFPHWIRKVDSPAEHARDAPFVRCISSASRIPGNQGMLMALFWEFEGL